MDRKSSVQSNMKRDVSLRDSLPEQGTSKQENETSGNRSFTPTVGSSMVTRKRNRVWSLVSEDDGDYKCIECNTVIKCCSPTNITRHYANNHPEVLQSVDDEAKDKLTKLNDQPALFVGAERGDDTTEMDALEPGSVMLQLGDSRNVLLGGCNMSMSSEKNNVKKAQNGKVDWTSPAIQRVLEMIASRELTEKMGTEMIAYKSGTHVSQSAVRKRVHFLLESKYGEYPSGRKSNAQGRTEVMNDGGDQTVTYLAMTSDGGTSKLVKLEGRKILEQETSEKAFDASPPPVPRQARSLRLSRSSIVIPEKDDPSKVRVYRCSAYARGKSATCYYRCSKCDTIASNKQKSEGTDGDSTKRYFAHIKIRDGQIIGNAYPEHLPECKPVPKEVQQLQEIDRACRARIQEGNLTPEAARKLGALVAQKNRELKRHIQDDDAFPDKWKSLPKKYSRLCHQAERMKKQRNKQLLRMMNKGPGDSGLDENQSATAREAELMGQRFKHPPLIIFEPDGQAARIYRINGKSDRLGIAYYRCSKCDVICRKYKKMGADGMIRATVRVEEDQIIENMYPPHHEECEVLTLDMVKGLTEELDRFFFAKDYENVIHDSAKTDLRFADGTLISKQEIPMEAVEAFNHSCPPMEHVVEDGVAVDISHVANTEEVEDNEVWDPILSQESLNSNLEEHRAGEGFSCHRYYEANLALRREMMRCLEEMKALRTEMRNMLEESRLQFIEVDDDHYEEVVVDEDQ